MCRYSTHLCSELSSDYNTSSPPPELGEHTVEILENFGFSSEKINQLLEDEIIK